MLEPRIKTEQSPEEPLSATPSKRRGAIATLFAASPSDRKRDDDAAQHPPKYTPRPLPFRAFQGTQQPPATAKIKSEPTDEDNVVAAVPASATVGEVPPQDNRLVGSRHASGRHGAQALPVASSLSSRPVPVPKQTVVFTKTNPAYNFLAGSYRPHWNRLLVNHYALPTFTKGTRAERMYGLGFSGGNDVNGSEEMDFNALGSYMGVQDQMQQMVTMPLAEYQSLQNEVHTQRAVMTELFDLSQKLFAKVHQLDARVAQLEQGDAPLNPLTTSNMGIGVTLAAAANGDIDSSPSEDDMEPVSKASAKRSVAQAFSGEGVTMPGRTKYRKKLEVKIPGKATAHAPGAGFLTPMPSALQTAPPTALATSFPTTPRTPYTPGRIGPPDSYKRTTTSINKRDIHNLNKSMPPANVQLPMVPLTDTEVIVYFFNSLSKPTVSLRLYSRGWGPASIVQCLNDHREVKPPYLRNTCSVKCTTAIKLGKKLYGEEWEDDHRAAFGDAGDAKATDLIRADENVTVDYYVRALGVNLKKHPADGEAGIFTECVKYCIENNASYTMSNVFQLAIDLRDGNVPQHPESPAPADVAPIPRAARRTKEDDESEGELTEDETDRTPSPLAERASFLGRTGGSINFTAVNTHTEQHNDEEEEVKEDEDEDEE